MIGPWSLSPEPETDRMTLSLIVLVLSVGLADSLNPSTIGPALYLGASGKRVLKVTQFTVGVFGVNLLAGVLLTIGPGRLLLSLVPHPRGTAKHIIELVAGLVLLVAAVALWQSRRNLARRQLPMSSSAGGSALVAGASIAAVELPTAAPYFAAIAAIVASSASLVGEVVLLVLFNVAFVLPLLAIIGVLLLAGQRANDWLEAGADWLQRRWPVILATLLLLVGAALTVLGGAGLIKE
jgi:cytochrome c biogenesis protein CcdA